MKAMRSVKRTGYCMHRVSNWQTRVRHEKHLGWWHCTSPCYMREPLHVNHRRTPCLCSRIFRTRCTRTQQMGRRAAERWCMSDPYAWQFKYRTRCRQRWSLPSARARRLTHVSSARSSPDGLRTTLGRWIVCESGEKEGCSSTEHIRSRERQPSSQHSVR